MNDDRSPLPDGWAFLTALVVVVLIASVSIAWAVAVRVF